MNQKQSKIYSVDFKCTLISIEDLINLLEELKNVSSKHPLFDVLIKIDGEVCLNGNV